MNIYYNKDGIGDTLLIQLKAIELDDRATEQKGDVVRIFHKETNETVGYNIFHVSNYGHVEGNGPVERMEDVVQLSNRILSENGFDDQLKADLRPKFIVGLVKEKEKHPNADKLSICKVDIGEETLQIVCGAPNVEQGQKVVVARVGAIMPSGLVIKEASLRGVDSSGMICSAKELDLPNAPQEKGILVLPEDAQVGTDFFQSKNR
ncbi:DUF4479 domain-containing protein [Fictibacillus sp. Mic-4]|uniref:YtpR family tRNA-binding protein n=1 Tax=Fictibacillus TaxID=1329200 RepID=UPI00042438FA|nr:DUF4479 family protein [Fictibacillus gelatini]